MKNRVLTIFALMSLAIVTFFSSCEKDEQSTDLKIDETKTATIKGKVWANLTQANDENFTMLDAVASGTILAKVAYTDYNSGASNDEQSYKIQTVTISNGEYSFTIPTTKAGVTVTLYPQDFTATQALYTPDINGDWVKADPQSQVNKYSADPIDVEVFEGETKIQTISYNDYYYSE